MGTARDIEMNDAILEAVANWLKDQPEYKKSKELEQVSAQT